MTGPIRRTVLALGCACAVSLGSAPGRLPAQAPLVAPDASALYLAGRDAPPGDWIDREFVENGWEFGTLGIGYEYEGDFLPTTLINTFLGEMRGAHASAYVRVHFEVEDLERLRRGLVQFGIQFDDGFVAYLNGVEIARAGLEGEPPAFDELARPPREIGREPDWSNVPLELLVEGDNVLAVEGHNDALDSPDFSLVPQLRFFEDLCPTELACNHVEERGYVRLIWEHPVFGVPYERMEIVRDGEVIGEPPEPTARTYRDVSPPQGTHTYEVFGWVNGERCEVAPRCTVRVGEEPEAPRFRRGDADGSGEVDLTDVVHLLNWIFLAGPSSRCADAADASDAGELNVTTAVYLLNWLFLGGPDLPAPGVFCGEDASQDALDCVQYEGC